MKTNFVAAISILILAVWSCATNRTTDAEWQWAYWPHRLAYEMTDNIGVTPEDHCIRYYRRSDFIQFPDQCFEAVREFQNGRGAVRLNSLWGFVNEAGELAIAPQFEGLNNFGFRNSAAGVRYNGKWGVIDQSGNWILEPIYDYVGIMSEGIIPVEINGKWGYISRDRKEIAPTLFEYAHMFSDGMGCVRLNGRYGYVDSTGAMVIAPQFGDCGEFHEGMARIIADEGPGKGKRGFIDKTGKWIVAPRFKSAGDFSCGLAPVETDDGWFGYVNKNDKMPIRPIYRRVTNFRSGKAEVCIKPPASDCQVLDVDGNVLNVEYDPRQ